MQQFYGFMQLSCLVFSIPFSFLLAGKIDMVKSKWGLALAAVVTVLSSLLMSVGLCTLFGLTPTLNGGQECLLFCASVRNDVFRFNSVEQLGGSLHLLRTSQNFCVNDLHPSFPTAQVFDHLWSFLCGRRCQSIHLGPLVVKYLNQLWIDWHIIWYRY